MAVMSPEMPPPAMAMLSRGVLEEAFSFDEVEVEDMMVMRGWRLAKKDKAGLTDKLTVRDWRRNGEQ